MARSFERVISIDWSGAATENDRVDLRVAVWDQASDACTIQLPTAGRVRSWTRNECRDYLRAKLEAPLRTLVAMDFGLSLPWGADQALFEVKGWRAMVRAVAAVYGEAGTARVAATNINEWTKFNGHGPFRFNEHRNDFRFYVDTGIAYYRMTELAAPQAISQWYLGSGGTVGFHTITGLAVIDWLLGLREAGALQFAVHPFEPIDAQRHVLVESYPAICPSCEHGAADIRGNDERDAWRVLQMLKRANDDGTIDSWFDLPEPRFGRVEGADVSDQIRFEGWIFGLR